MSLSKEWLPSACWLTWPVACYFGVRRLSNPWVRGVLTATGCCGLLAWSVRDLPTGSMSTVLKCSLYWMCSIRLVNLMTLPDQERLDLTFGSFVKKFTWFLLPVSQRNSLIRRRPLELAVHVGYHLGMVATKLVFAQWMSAWIAESLDAAGGGQLVTQSYLKTIPYTAMFCTFVAGSTFDNDLQIALVSLLTLDRYEVLPFNDFPVVSASLRELWGRRYNKLVSTLLRESVFQPLRKQAGWSPAMASMAAFAVSGALHMHVAVAGFGGGCLPALLFFLLHGCGCLLETKLGMHRLPRPVGMLLTQGFLLATAPLYLGLFVAACPEWMRNHPLKLMGMPVKLPFELPVPGALPA